MVLNTFFILDKSNLNFTATFSDKCGVKYKPQP